MMEGGVRRPSLAGGGGGGGYGESVAAGWDAGGHARAVEAVIGQVEVRYAPGQLRRQAAIRQTPSADCC